MAIHCKWSNAEKEKQIKEAKVRSGAVGLQWVLQ
jgi:hypothetical protein